MISTGQSDWPHTVTAESNSLASYVDPLLSTATKPAANGNGAPTRKIPGIVDPMQSSKVTILNGSHRSVSEDHDSDTVLVFPDFKVVTEVEHSKKGAEELCKVAVDPGVSRSGHVLEGAKAKSWVLPYSAVIMICELAMLSSA